MLFASTSLRSRDVGLVEMYGIVWPSTHTACSRLSPAEAHRWPTFAATQTGAVPPLIAPQRFGWRCRTMMASRSSSSPPAVDRPPHDEASPAPDMS